MAENKSGYYDVVIMGGGLAGLSLALQLKQRRDSLSILVIEKQFHPVQHAAHKVGESLVELATYYFAETLGLRQHLDDEQLPKLGLRLFFNPDAKNLDNTIGLDKRLEIGANLFPPSPSYQLDRGIFENYLGQRCIEQGISFWSGFNVNNVSISNTEANHTIEVRDISKQALINVDAKYVVDASSRASLIKRKLGLSLESQHKVSAAWFRVDAEISVNDWSESVDWRDLHPGDNSRWFSTNHLMGEGYWVWLIPLSSGSTSIGIVADDNYHDLSTYNNIDKAMTWLGEHQPLCAEKIRPYLGKIQDFKFLKNFAHDAKQVYSNKRWFLTGEAGSFLDPFYSPGSDIIGISNTFVSNIIEASEKGEDTNGMSFILNLFYLNIIKNTNLVYQGQYHLFGNPVVMPVKVLWDFAVYWSFTAFLFIQGLFSDTNRLFALRGEFEILGEMNGNIQQLFSDWGKLDSFATSNDYIDPFQFPFLKDLNDNLYKDYKEDEIASVFKENLAKLALLQGDIAQAAVHYHPQLDISSFATTGNREQNIVLQLLKRIDKNS
jgi:flavin-dependent dehydrogenase